MDSGDKDSRLGAGITTERYSRCPYCLAVFRVRPEKLAVRQGEVRCGACREVFNATWHFVELDEQGRFVPERITATESPAEDSAPIAETSSPSAETVDESIQRPGEDDTPPPEDTATIAESDSGDDSAADWPRFTVLETDDEINSDAVDQGQSADDEVSSRSAPLADSIPDEVETRNVAAELDTSTVESSPDESLGIRSEEASLLELEVAPRSAHGNWFNAEPDSMLERNPFREGRGDSVDNGESTKPASINMHGVDAYIEDRPNPLVGLFWFLVSVGFVFLLGLQVREYFVDRYAQDEQYRPYLSLFCRIAACELPARRDTYRFAITNTRIDLHPEEPGALKITVKLVNQAVFAQPYPELQLTLTDRVGRVVGRRTFSPDFYLTPDDVNVLDSGELGSVEFDLARPHEKAVGFVVDIVRESGV